MISSSVVAVAAGLAMWTGVDAVYLYLIAEDAYVGGWIDLIWPAGALVIATGAVSSSRMALGRPRDDQPTVLIPMIAALAAIFVLMLDHFDPVSTESIWLGGATLVAAAVRLLISSSENRRLVRALSRDSVTDPLTGLGNRRRLSEELERLLASEASGGRYLAMFDLDGFKTYNDTFGHSLGDALLRNLGYRLQDAARPVGSAYRLGGDEFCVLIESWEGNPEPAVQGLRRALCERGDSFEIGASCGLVRLGTEVHSANEALRIADQRMYADKGDRARRIQHREAHDVLLSVLREHEPALEQHIEGVGGLARAVAERLGLAPDEVETVARAAELHDIGKVAIPDTILRKPGPLTDDEWALMREHTLIGERILSVVPALRSVGSLIRSSHERWDGRGYPDGLAGEEIPLGARIIFVCDAFDAMTEERPYQGPKQREEAAAELKRHAGSQFDSEVVRVFCEILDGPEMIPERVLVRT
jgi:diguanylate cyclase (GGDEF)-like protein